MMDSPWIERKLARSDSLTVLSFALPLAQHLDNLQRVQRFNVAHVERKKEENSAYVIHPACADATLHLGAIGQRDTAVPVGIQAAFSSARPAIRDLGTICTAVAELPLQANTADLLVSQNRMGTAMVNVGLKAKVMKHLNSRRRHLETASRFEYCIDWQRTTQTQTKCAGLVEMGNSSPMMRVSPVDTQAISGKSRITITQDTPFQAAGATLALLQGAVVDEGSSTLHLHVASTTVDEITALKQPSTASVGASMVKVAAIEEHDKLWSVQHEHQSAPAANLLRGSPNVVDTPQDQHGTAVRGGEVAQPLLLKIAR